MNDGEKPSDDNGVDFDPSPDRSVALATLRTIRDATTSTTTEKINAIRGIEALIGKGDGEGKGPGMMTRDEIASELDRLKRLTKG